ncbi:cylicin-2-like [Drosophila tropicalis]|uniref:cylicin-2-like n=1 Tax=Drosophila tropicalis TaxID=46794 RepID=UPI0035AB919D
MSETNEVDGLTTTPPEELTMNSNKQTDPHDTKEDCKEQTNYNDLKKSETTKKESTKDCKEQVNPKDFREIEVSMEIQLTEGPKEQASAKNLEKVKGTKGELTKESNEQGDIKKSEAIKKESTKDCKEQVNPKDFREIEVSMEIQLTESPKEQASAKNLEKVKGTKGELTKESNEQGDIKKSEAIKKESTKDCKEQVNPKDFKEIEISMEIRLTEDTKEQASPKDLEKVKGTKGELTKESNEQGDIKKSEAIKKESTKDCKDSKVQPTPKDLKEFEAAKEKLKKDSNKQTDPHNTKDLKGKEQATKKDFMDIEKALKLFKNSSVNLTDDCKVNAIPKNLQKIETTKEKITKEGNEQANHKELEELVDSDGEELKPIKLPGMLGSGIYSRSLQNGFKKAKKFFASSEYLDARREAEIAMKNSDKHEASLKILTSDNGYTNTSSVPEPKTKFPETN